MVFEIQLLNGPPNRPLNDDEQRLNVQKVISCNEQKNEVTVIQGMMNKQVDKTFTFDKVCQIFILFFLAY